MSCTANCSPSLLPESALRARSLAECLARGDREAFARLVLGLDLTAFHRLWLEFCDAESRTVLLAPRGHGKTTICDILYVLWAVLSNPDIRVLIVSNTMGQAKAFLREIAAHLQREEIEKLWGPRKGERWTETEIQLPRKRVAKEPTVTAVGTGGAIISRHYDLIICDDIIDEENSSSARQREKVRTWFYKTLMPCLEPDGRMHIIGTRWHYGDLYGELSKRWKLRIDRAIDREGKVLWPDKFSADTLAAVREQAGERIFNCQYNNDPSGYEGAIFKYKHFRFYEPGTQPSGLRCFCGVDLAVSQSETADYFAHAVVGLDDDGQIYVLEVFRDRLTFHRQVEFILSRATLYKPMRIAVESFAYQKAMVQEIMRRSTVPVQPMQEGKDKVARAWRLAAHFEQGRVFVPTDSGELQEELMQFPHGEHDDQVDALGYAAHVASSYGSFLVKEF
ncbi:MAG: phage terminase large subunit [Planctomycetota bacterium]|nr:phage terminase large subunit [Planctomycetota bacterium]